MESPKADSSGSPPLPPEPPDPDIDVMFPVVPPVPPVPPDPPPILIDTSVLSVQPLLMHHLLAEAALSSFLTTRLASTYLQLVPGPKPRNLVSCGEHVSYTQIYVARVVGLLTADCKFTSFHFSSLQVLEDWTLKDVLAEVDLRYAASLTSVQPFGVQLSTALSSSELKANIHLKPWSHMVGPISPCSMLSQDMLLVSQGMVAVSFWSESFLFDHCLREDINWLSRISLFHGKQEIMLGLNDSLPRIEEFINPLSFRLKLRLPQCEEAVIWISVFVAMDAFVSGLAIWPWWFASQQAIFWKRCLVASELVDVSFPVGYVENFPTCSANGTWQVISTQSAKAVLLQKAHHSILSSGLSSFQILADITVPFFALGSGLVLIEITGFFVKSLVPLVTPLSCSYILFKTFCLVVVFVMGEVPIL